MYEISRTAVYVAYALTRDPPGCAQYVIRLAGARSGESSRGGEPGVTAVPRHRSRELPSPISTLPRAREPVSRAHGEIEAETTGAFAGARGCTARDPQMGGAISPASAAH